MPLPRIAFASLALLVGAPAQSRATGPQGEAAYAAVRERVAAWQRAHPDLVERIDIGRSAGGRPLFAVRVSAADDATVPELWINGGIHGHEGSERDALFLVDQLLARASQPAIRALLEHRALLVQPLANPDGVVSHTRVNARQVDLNRNFGGRWQPGRAGGHNPGPTAFSEPESRAIRDFLRTRSRLRAFVDLHRSTSLTIVATTDDAAHDAALLDAGQALAAAMGGPHSSRGAQRFGRIHGLAMDWAATELGVAAFAWENTRADQERRVEADPRWRGLLHLLENLDQLPVRARFDFDTAWHEVTTEFRELCAEHLVVGYEIHVDKNVLRPLGMHRSYFDVTPYHLRHHRSHSYRRLSVQPDAEDLGPDFDTGVTVSNGGLNAPLPDMARYLAFLLGAREDSSDAARVLARESLQQMWRPVVATARDGSEQMGLTYFLQQHGGQQFITHTGGQRSFVTFFYVHPASGTGALAAFNTSTAGPVMATVRRTCMEQLSLPLAGDTPTDGR